MRRLALVVLAALSLTETLGAEKLVIAAAADLKFAMDEVAAAYRAAHPRDALELIYGSSGKFFAQIQRGAPYDLYFSADIRYPQELRKAGHTASEVRPYALGRIVLWSSSLDASQMTLQSLLEPKIDRIAIANPKHAPYGLRAMEALKSEGLWERVEPKLVYGENIAHTAQFVQSGNAQVGVIALALALSPALASQGGHFLIPAELHEPLEQGYVITKRGARKGSARRFADFMGGPQAREVMRRYGFVLPGEDPAPPAGK